MAQFTLLPEELLLNILEYLPAADRTRASHTGTLLRRLYHSASWARVQVVSGLQPDKLCTYPGLRTVPLRVVVSPHRYSWFHSEATVELYYMRVKREAVLHGISAGGAAQWPRLELVKDHFHEVYSRSLSSVCTVETRQLLGSAVTEEGVLDVDPRSYTLYNYAYLEDVWDAGDFSVPLDTIVDLTVRVYADNFQSIVRQLPHMHALRHVRLEIKRSWRDVLSILVELSQRHPEFLPAELNVKLIYPRGLRQAPDPHDDGGIEPPLSVHCVTALHCCESKQHLIEAAHVFPRLRALRLVSMKSGDPSLSSSMHSDVYVMSKMELPFAATLTFMELDIGDLLADSNFVPASELPALQRLVLAVRGMPSAIAHTKDYDEVLVDYAQRYAAATLTKPEVTAVRAAVLAAKAEFLQDEFLERVMFARILALPESDDDYGLALQTLWKHAANAIEVRRRVRFEHLFQQVCEAAVRPGGRLQYVRVTLDGAVPFWLHRLAAHPGSVQQLLVMSPVDPWEQMHSHRDWEYMQQEFSHMTIGDEIAPTNKKDQHPSCNPATLPAHPHRLVVGRFGRNNNDTAARKKFFVLYDIAQRRTLHPRDGPICLIDDDLDTFDGWI